nr:RNA-directed DNA polymerase, eukaryota, reverse transcriptase zinc-binding domain protein [Tanacetum cinerariifolium]
RHFSDHRPIILNDIHSDFHPTPFRIYHSWFKRDGFDAMVEQADTNKSYVGVKKSISDELVAIDKILDTGAVSDELLANRLDLSHKLHELNRLDLKEAAQKAKFKWAIEGDENSKFFHGIINKRRSQLAICGVFHNGDWHTDPNLVKRTFLIILLFDFNNLIALVLNLIPGANLRVRKTYLRTWGSILRESQALALKGFDFLSHCKLRVGNGGSLYLSHLFYADDAVFIGEWSDDNLDNLIRILNCFHLALGLKINVNKSQVLGVGVPPNIVNQGASRIGCSVMHLPFKYLGVMAMSAYGFKIVGNEFELVRNYWKQSVWTKKMKENEDEEAWIACGRSHCYETYCTRCRGKEGARIASCLLLKVAISYVHGILLSSSDSYVQQRIVVFAGGNVLQHKDEMKALGKVMKEKDLACDVFNFGDQSENKKKLLDTLIAAADNNENCIERMKI